MRSVSQWWTIMLVNEAQHSSELLLIMQIQLTKKYHVMASTARPPKLWLSHPVPDSNIIKWLNLKGKLSFDLLRREKKLLWGSGTWLTPSPRKCIGLSWRQRDFLLLPIHRLEHSIYRHLKRTGPPQVIPEKCPPTLGKKTVWHMDRSSFQDYDATWWKTHLNKFSPPTAVCSPKWCNGTCIAYFNSNNLVSRSSILQMDWKAGQMQFSYKSLLIICH